MGLIASAASIMNGIATKSTMPIHRVLGNVYRQFPKHVIKNTSNGMMMGNLSFQRNLNKRIANLPYKVKGIDCFFRFHFEWYRLQIYHAYSPFVGQCVLEIS